MIEVDWAGCIQLQSLDHTFTRSNTVTALIAPRGHDVVAKLRKARWPYAGTGSLAAQPRSPVASPGRATIYTDHVDPAVYRKAIVFALLADRLDHLTDEARLECLGRLAPHCKPRFYKAELVMRVQARSFGLAGRENSVLGW